MYRCFRCSHRWNSRKNENPLICPKCKSPYWNKKSKRLDKKNIDLLKNSIILLHKKIISQSGGLQGIRDDGGLYNASYNLLKSIGSLDNFNVGVDILKDLSRRHYFNDGNKRTAFIVSKIVLCFLGVHINIDYVEAKRFMIDIADSNKNIKQKEIKDWIIKNSRVITEKNIEKYLKDIYYDSCFGGKNYEKF